MPKDKQVEIRITGSGPNTWVYAISDKTYKQLAKNDDEDDPIDIIKTDYVEGELVCWGLDVDRFSEFMVEIVQDGETNLINLKPVNLDGYETIEEACEWVDISPTDIVIPYNTADAKQLGDEFELGKCKHLVFETINFNKTILIARIPVTEKFDEKALTLIIRYMDVESQLSSAFYDLQLSESMEQDIIGVSYKGTEYLFDCESYGGNKPEYWVINKEGSDWNHDHTVSLVRFR